MDESVVDDHAAAAANLPVEVWTHILSYCKQAAEWRLVASRVCHTWRAIVCQRDRGAGRVPTHRGIEACRVRLARHALSVGDIKLFKWTINDLCALPLTGRARNSLWSRVMASGSPACARALIDAGVRPHCTCGCSGKGSPSDKCDAVAVVVRAAKNAKVDMLAVLCERDFIPFACWGYYALWDAVKFGNIPLLEFMHEREWIGGDHPTPKCTGVIVEDKSTLTWVELAAISGQLDALKWLVAHRIDPEGLDMALVHESYENRASIVVWLCERHHMEHFAKAFATGLKNMHYKTAESMLGFRREARTRYEADDDTLDEAVERARKDLDIARTDARATELVRRLGEP